MKEKTILKIFLICLIFQQTGLMANTPADNRLLKSLDESINNINVDVYTSYTSVLEGYENQSVLEVATVSNSSVVAISQNLLKLNMMMNKISKEAKTDPFLGVGVSADYSLTTSPVEFEQLNNRQRELKRKLLENHSHLYLSYRTLSIVSREVDIKCKYKNAADTHSGIVIQLKDDFENYDNVFERPVVQLAITKINASDWFNNPQTDPCSLVSGPTRQEMNLIMDNAVASQVQTKLNERVQIFHDIVLPISEELTALLNNINSLNIQTLFADIKSLEKRLKDSYVNYAMMKDDLLKLGERITFVKEKIAILKKDQTNLDIFVDFNNLVYRQIKPATVSFFDTFNEGGTCKLTAGFEDFLNSNDSAKDSFLANMSGQLSGCFDKKIETLQKQLGSFQDQPDAHKVESLGKSISQVTFYMRKAQ